MSVAGEAREALLHLQAVVRRRWTSGSDAHAVLCAWGKKIRDKFATDNTPVLVDGVPDLRPVVELLQSMKETINNNHHQLTSHMRTLDGKIGRLEVDVKGLQVRPSVSACCLKLTDCDTSLWMILLFVFGGYVDTELR